ncbi:MAG: cytochrome c oxidase subunit II [Marinobacter sp.]|jgi:cytochrome c oxidase subunit 2
MNSDKHNDHSPGIFSMRRKALRGVALMCLPLSLAACDFRQSALAPAGRDADTLADLFWVLLIGAVVLWLLMNGLIFYLTRINIASLPRRWANRLIIGGGIIFPTVVLSVLLVYALSIMPDQRAPGDGLTLRVTGEQWWWRVEYLPEGRDEPIISANEIRLPTEARADILLDAKRVIHSFWIPALGGKMDMFPGRETRMSLEPHTPGVYRGQCAEFCGESHAKMAFEAVVMTPDDFDAWLQNEAADALPPTGAEATRGAELFATEGCGACHAIRGTEHRGQVGPDLTHIGTRQSLAAGSLGTDRADFLRWLRDPDAIKPGVEMPGYDHLPPEDLAALTAYLMGLE